MKQIRKRLTYANVMSSAAVFLIISGGAAFAAIQLPKNSVGTKQLKKNAVDSTKVKDHSLGAADFKAGQLPAGPQGPPGTVDTSSFFTKGQSDARYLRGTITVLARETVIGSAIEYVRATCPAGYEAIGGGVDTSNVSGISVTASEPFIENTPRMTNLTTGQHQSATGWTAWVRNDTATVGTVTAAAICAPIG